MTLDDAEITQVEHLVLRPWEALVVHVAGWVNSIDIRLVKEQVEAVLPPGAHVIVCTEGISLEVVTPVGDSSINERNHNA